MSADPEGKPHIVPVVRFFDSLPAVNRGHLVKLSTMVACLREKNGLGESFTDTDLRPEQRRTG
jgi:hypothetical protein